MLAREVSEQATHLGLPPSSGAKRKLKHGALHGQPLAKRMNQPVAAVGLLVDVLGGV
jgi:hypothetical protein